MKLDLTRIDLRPTSGTAALASLQHVATHFRAQRDARASFPDIYGMITQHASEEALRTPSRFQEPIWISRLMGRFCERYLETLVWSLEGRPQDCSAWAMAYRYAASGCTIPFQDVVLGLSAHINYDLALGISQTILEFGGADDPKQLARYKHDHDHINVLLRAAIPDSFVRLDRDYGCRTSALLWNGARPVVFRVVMGALSVWREEVWRQVLALLRAKDQRDRQRVIRQMDRRSGRIARTLIASSWAWQEVVPAPMHGRVRTLLLRERRTA